MIEKIGVFLFNAFTFGTDCPTCIGWRIGLALFIMFFVGFCSAKL
jgi:hypothetical protein